MRGRVALGGRHCRRRAGHDLGLSEIGLGGAAPAAAALAAAAVLLTACVGTPRASHTSAPPAVTVEVAPDTVPETVRAAMIEHAVAMLGQPYRWGGAAPGGFDCSGLVYYAAASAGVHLPRTASEQRRLGSSVSLKHLEPGDLVFMHLSRKELHVGIVLDGTRFIHAPSSGGRVRIDSISAAPYSAGFIGARRIIDKHTMAATAAMRAATPAAGSPQ